MDSILSNFSNSILRYNSSYVHFSHTIKEAVSTKIEKQKTESLGVKASHIPRLGGARLSFWNSVWEITFYP